MKTIKVIDLLNKIANGEEVPKKIKIGFSTLTYNKMENNYQYDEGSDEYYGDYLIHWFELNDTVEVIEDTPKEESKIPEELKLYAPYPECDDTRFDDVEEKINEIIKYLESKVNNNGIMD